MGHHQELVMLHRHRDDQSTSSRDGMAKLSTDPTVGGEGKQAMATAPTTSASASTVVSRTDGGRNGGSTEIETCRRCREDDKTGGCSRKALEARCAAESTARIAAEERAERAERTVNELKKVVLRAGRAQGGVVAECGAVDAAQLRIRRLEAHLGEARAGASKAEEMLKKKREACESMCRQIARLEEEAGELGKTLRYSLTSTTATAPCSPAAVVKAITDSGENSPIRIIVSPASDPEVLTAKALLKERLGQEQGSRSSSRGGRNQQHAETPVEIFHSLAAVANRAIVHIAPSTLETTTGPAPMKDQKGKTHMFPPIFIKAIDNAHTNSLTASDNATSNSGVRLLVSTAVGKHERAPPQGVERLGAESCAPVISSRDHDGASAAAVAAAAIAAAATATATSAGTPDISRYSRTFGGGGEGTLPPPSPPGGDGNLVIISAANSRSCGGNGGGCSVVGGGCSPFGGKESVGGAGVVMFKGDNARRHQVSPPLTLHLYGWQTHRGGSSKSSAHAACTTLDQGPVPFDDVKCIEIPVGREDEGLLLGGGRVLHKLKEELGGTLEYRRSQGVVSVHGQEAGPRKAAACVRTALLLRDGSGEPKADEYSLARLCMDDLMAECIALKGLGQAGSGARGQAWSDSPAVVCGSGSGAGSSSATSSPTSSEGSSTEPWSPVHQASKTTTITPTETNNSTVTVTVTTTPAAAAAAAAAAVSVASNLPDGEYPPETASLRIIGEKYGCVIDVVGEAASDAAAAAVAAASTAFETGRVGTAGLLVPVGSATPVGHQDVLIWGPAGVVREAKDAVAALVSANACAEVVVGAGRIQRRDRGFWVNCETMASGLVLEIDHKRGSAWVRGRPEAVEDGRKEFQNKLASLFPGDFLAVPMPRAALKDLANARGLVAAAADANAERGPDEKFESDEVDGVELWADWPCSCVRLRGEPAVVRRAAKALYARLAQWNTLEVSVLVDRAIVTRLLSRSGRILAGISSNMGITLLVEREKGVLRGRARTEDNAKEANRVLKLKVAALSQRRSEQNNNNAAAATTSSTSPKGPALSPGLSSTNSDRSGMSLNSNSSGGDDNPNDHDKELTDPVDELLAFFAGAPLLDGSLNGGNPAASSKRSCVFDGVEDVPSSTGMALNGNSKGTGTQRNGGRGRQENYSSRSGPGSTPSGSGSGRSRSGGGSSGNSSAAAAGMVTKSSARTSHDQNNHLVHTNRRSVIVHRPALSPSSCRSGACSPPFGGVGERHQAFHHHGPPPASSPPPTLHHHHYQHPHQQEQQQQNEHERRPTWPLVNREEQRSTSHHQHNYHRSIQAPHSFTSAAVGHGGSQAACDKMNVSRAYEGHICDRSTAPELYGSDGGRGRGHVRYPAAPLPHRAVSCASDRRGARDGEGAFSGHHSCVSLSNDEYGVAYQMQQQARWTSEAGFERHSLAQAYPMENRATAVGTPSLRGW